MTDCPICFEKIDKHTYTTMCCNQPIHLQCLNTCLSRFSRCPMCNKTDKIGKMYNDAIFSMYSGNMRKAKRSLQYIANGDESNPYFVKSLYNLSIIYFYKQKYNECQSYLVRALYSGGEDDDHILVLYGHTLFMMKDYQAALFIYNNVADKKYKIYQIMMTVLFPELPSNIREGSLTSLLHILLRDKFISPLRRCLYTYYLALSYADTNVNTCKKYSLQYMKQLDQITSFTLEDEIELLMHFGVTSRHLDDIIEINNYYICCY